jgi:hypothetical protein
MVATTAVWLLVLAAGAVCRIWTFCAHPTNDYETWWDFQLVVYLIIQLPLALPLLIAALAVEFWMLGPKAGAAQR